MEEEEEINNRKKREMISKKRRRREEQCEKECGDCNDKNNYKNSRRKIGGIIGMP